MQYIHVAEKQNYEMFSAWRVLYSVPGSAPFPVRLIDEIFQRCCALIWKYDNINIYDPCIWSGYMMTVLWFLHYEKIVTIVWSDIDEEKSRLARKNLSLLTLHWLESRIDEINLMFTQFGKQSHRDAWLDAKKLLWLVAQRTHDINIATYVSSLVSPIKDITKQKFDIILFDAPYGSLTQRSETIDLPSICVTLSENLSAWGVLVVVTDKKSQKVKQNTCYKKTMVFTHWKRRINFLIK